MEAKRRKSVQNRESEAKTSEPLEAKSADIPLAEETDLQQKKTPEPKSRKG